MGELRCESALRFPTVSWQALFYSGSSACMYVHVPPLPSASPSLCEVVVPLRGREGMGSCRAGIHSKSFGIWQFTFLWGKHPHPPQRPRSCVGSSRTLLLPCRSPRATRGGQASACRSLAFAGVSQKSRNGADDDDKMAGFCHTRRKIDADLTACPCYTTTNAKSRCGGANGGVGEGMPCRLLISQKEVSVFSELPFVGNSHR
jgi:hypothetical protein